MRKHVPIPIYNASLNHITDSLSLLLNLALFRFSKPLEYSIVTSKILFWEGGFGIYFAIFHMSNFAKAIVLGVFVPRESYVTKSDPAELYLQNNRDSGW